MKLLVYSALLLIAGMSFAGNYARYTYSEYQTDASDGVAGVYFAAVYPSGSTANTNGAYVVGWIAPYRAGIPERWPISRGWMNAHEMEYWPGSGNGFSLHVTKSE